MKNKISIIVPAHNEEANLEKCIKSLNKARDIMKKSVKTFICLSECKDKTPEIAKKCKEKYKNMNIKILKNKKGKLNAQEGGIKEVKSNGPVIFVDADVEVEKESIKKLLAELDKHKNLIAVGSFPIAKKYKGKNLWKKFLDEILNIRSRHPKSEISKLDVEDYHPYAFSDPQNKNTSPKHESQSKIFFHGRLFALRSKKYWSKPKNKKIVGDDSYIPDYITHKYGKGRIRIRYDSIVYYIPFTSLLKHFQTYKRIYFDLENLKKYNPRFKKIREHSQLKLDHEYIKKQPWKTRIKFRIYSLIRKIERFLYKFFINKDPFEIWD